MVDYTNVSWVMQIWDNSRVDLFVGEICTNVVFSSKFKKHVFMTYILCLNFFYKLQRIAFAICRKDAQVERMSNCKW